MAKALVRAGFSENAAGLHVEMTRAFQRGCGRLPGRPQAQNTTSIRFEDFAVGLTQAYRAA